MKKCNIYTRKCLFIVECNAIVLQNSGLTPRIETLDVSSTSKNLGSHDETVSISPTHAQDAHYDEHTLPPFSPQDEVSPRLWQLVLSFSTAISNSAAPYFIAHLTNTNARKYTRALLRRNVLAAPGRKPKPHTHTDTPKRSDKRIGGKSRIFRG